MKLLRMHNLLVYSLFLSLIACEFNKIDCSKNCGTINVSGVIMDKTTGTAVANIPFTLLQIKKGICLLCNRPKIHEGVSDKNGNFRFSVDVDTTLLTSHILKLKIAENSAFMTLPEYIVDRDVPVLDAFEPNGLTNLTLEVFPKTNLTINLKRTQKDTFQNLSIEHEFVENARFFNLNATSPAEITKTQLIVPTTTGVFTRVFIKKQDKNGNWTEKTDSILCTKTGKNAIDVFY